MRSKKRKPGEKKRANTVKILDYLSNPENEFVTKKELALTVIGYKREQSLYSCFTPAELDDIINQAVEERKNRSGAQRIVVYQALYDAAKAGNVAAIKEFLDRIEGKVPQQVDGRLEVRGNLGEALARAEARVQKGKKDNGNS